MGPATDEELEEHDLPSVRLLCYDSYSLLTILTQARHTRVARREGPVELAKTEKNKALYEYMQRNDITEHAMEDMLRMLRSQPFGDDTIARSTHVLSEAGQVYLLLICLLYCHIFFND